jgi:DNA-binding MarR family transcriptional regulator
MVADRQTELNDFLVNVFNEILRIEENCLRSGEFKNLSVREMHVIEAVCAAQDQGINNRAGDIAQAQGISAGTLTTAVTCLVRKGCIERRIDPQDKRIIRLYATEKGRCANEVHQRFHQDMVSGVLAALSPEESDILIKGLRSLKSFFDGSSKKPQSAKPPYL